MSTDDPKPTEADEAAEDELTVAENAAPLPEVETAAQEAAAAEPPTADATDDDVAEISEAPLVEVEPEPEPELTERQKARLASVPKRARTATPVRPTEAVVVSAQAKYVRTSARKARLVCDHIRGKSVDEATAILAHTPRAVAEAWEKLLKSAVANAEHNHELVADELKIHQVFADEGPTLKRFRPRAMGRATPIRKRTSHLTIQLTQKEA